MSKKIGIKDSHATGFHAGGADAYEAALHAEYESKRKELEASLRQTQSDEERLRLAAEIRELQTKYRAATAHWGYKLF